MPVTMPHENIVSKTEPPTELIEPKTEYIEEPNEASVDLTMDDDDLDEDLDHAKPGPSHGGEGSSRQGLFEQWHMTERSSDEDFLNAQEAAQQAVASGAAGAAGPASHRDPQDNKWSLSKLGPHVCYICGRGFKHEGFLVRHNYNMHLKKDPTNQCPECKLRHTSQNNLIYHIRFQCGKKPYAWHCDKCSLYFNSKKVLMRHKMKKHLPSAAYMKYLDELQTEKEEQQ